MSGSQGQVNPIRIEELSFVPRQRYKPVSFVGKHSDKELLGFDFAFDAWGPQEQQAIDRIFDQNTVTAIDPVTGRSFEATVRLLTSSYTEGAPTKAYIGELREIDQIPHVEEIEIEGQRFRVITYTETEPDADNVGREVVLKLTPEEFRQFHTLLEADTVLMQRIGVDEKPLSLRFGSAFYWSIHESEEGRYYKQIVRFFPVDMESNSATSLVVPLTYYDALAGMVVRLTERVEALLHDLMEQGIISEERRNTIIGTYDDSLVSKERAAEISRELRWVYDAEEMLD